jgi:hypothetical protein
MEMERGWGGQKVGMWVAGESGETDTELSKIGGLIVWGYIVMVPPSTYEFEK